MITSHLVIAVLRLRSGINWPRSMDEMNMNEGQGMEESDMDSGMDTGMDNMSDETDE